jgi:hypothetical protein
VPANLSDVEDVPPAARILALGPQTITLNLIVGVLSIAQPRDVTTRWGRRLSLVEVLVGDDTKSGFAITFWLDTPPSHASRALDAAVRGLRRQDVVLVRNVGLHAFRGRVYGQSLRHGLTQLSLLWRRDGSGHYSTRALARRSAAGGSAVHPQTQKTRLVKDWVLRFVTPHAPSTRSTRSAKKTWDDPPDDTQQCLTESE